MVRRLAKEKVAPGATRRDEEGNFDWAMVDLLRENGLLGIDYPEEFGGANAGILAKVIAIEELSKVDAACGLLVSVHSVGCLPIILGANEEQRRRYLPKLSAGEHLAAFALTEPSAGSDVAGLHCRARRDGDFYVLSGTKNFISNGGVADIVTVYAVTDVNAPPQKGASVFVVEKGTPGFSVGKKENKMGVRWSETRELIFENCRIPSENLLGEEGNGLHIMMKSLSFSRLGIAAQAVGIASGALEFAVGYAKERVAFGRPIIEHQGIGFKLADMVMRTEAARQLLYKTCSLFQEQPGDLSRLTPELIRMSSMSKCFCADTAMWVATQAVQVLGGYGYTKEFPVERMMRDAKITQIYEGTNEIQRLTIARSL